MIDCGTPCVDSKEYFSFRLPLGFSPHRDAMPYAYLQHETALDPGTILHEGGSSFRVEPGEGGMPRWVVIGKLKACFVR